MSKIFLEIIETTEQENPGNLVEPVKIKVRDKAEAESKMINAEKGFAGKKYIARLHYCFHNKNGRNRPCKISILKTVDK